MTYVLQIVGVVVLSVLVDVLLPNGQINKFIKGVFSVVLTFTVLTPLSGLAVGQFDIFQEGSGVSLSVDEDYLSQIERNKNEYYSEVLENALNEKGIVSKVTYESGSVRVEVGEAYDASTIKDVIRSHIGISEENIVIVYG